MNDQAMATNFKEFAGKRYHEMLLDDAPMYADPMSSYWQTHFQAAAHKLDRLMGRERYNRWYDLRFPLEDEGRVFTRREKFEQASGALTRILAWDDKAREMAIQRELEEGLHG